MTEEALFRIVIGAGSFRYSQPLVELGFVEIEWREISAMLRFYP
jgi:hypothetical protein